MARTKQKSKGLTVRRVKSKEDRKRPSVFMRLKADESFKGIALFEPDPELEDNPGYFEYYDHYDNQANQYVPCAGDACPFCAANDNPATRALSVWYFPENDKNEQIKVFTLNYGTINEMADEAEEEDGILGKKLRLKRLDDRGKYRVKVLGDKPMTKSELKKALKMLEEKFAEGLDDLVTKQLKTQMERLRALDALEDDDDDDDDDDEPKGKARRGKAVKDEEDETDDEDEDEDEDEEEDEDDEDEDESEDDDEDEDESEDEEDEDEDEDESEDEAEAISGGAYEVVKFQEKDEILDLKNDDGKVKMWVGEGVDADADELKKGVNVTIDAEQDDEGDWIITALKVKKARGGKGGKKK